MSENNMIPRSGAPAELYGQNNLETMYPDIYKSIYPYVTMKMSELSLQQPWDTQITDEMIRKMADDIVTRSGMAMDTDDDPPELIPVQRGGYRRPRRDRNTLQELARILLLRELAGRRRHYYPYPPYPYYPYPY